MNKEAWTYYKKNNLKLIWRNAQIGWCHTLPYKLHLIDFLKKHFRKPEKIFYNIQKLRFLIVRKPVIPCLEVMMTTRCTMKCKHCNSFMPYYTDKTHQALISYEEFKKDIDTLLKAVDYVDYFGFVGGEPLLNKDLAKMIEYACKQRKIRRIFLATNCTILPSQELLNAMQNKKVSVQLSDYRDVKFKNNLVVHYGKIKEILAKNNIKFSHPEEDGNRMTFQSMPELYPDKQDEKKLRKLFDCCWGQYCYMLCDGILSQCTLSVYIARNMKLSDDIKKELINIREEKSSKKLTQEIINFYAKPFSAFCHYCHNDNIKYGLPVGEQVE